MASSNYIITGGGGFIGSHLTERLLSEGHCVRIVDDFSTGSTRNLQHLTPHPNLTLYTGTVSQCPYWEEWTDQCQGIFHLAAAVGVQLVVQSPIQTIQTNLTETEAILRFASRNNTPLLLTSTSEVYGKSSKETFEERDDLLIGPPYLGRWSYACSKLMDEFLALAYYRERGLPIVITRLFNTVGPRQTGAYGMVMPRFIQAALAHTPLQIYGDGSQSRCFGYVGDTVEALIRLMQSPVTRGEIYNIGGTEEITILHLAQRIIEILDSRSSIEFIPYEKAYAEGFQDMQRRRPSVEKLFQTLGFKPETPLENIILRTAEAMKSQG